MTHLHYALRTLSSHRLTTAVSVLSIGLGIFMSSLLFARVAYDNSVDSCFGDADRLYQVTSTYTVGGNRHEPDFLNFGPLAGAIVAELSDMAEAATMTREFNGAMTLDGQPIEDASVLMADTLTMATLGVELVSGDSRMMALPGQALISTTLAKRLAADADPIGLTLDGRFGPLRVAGVYRDWGEETTLPAGIMVSQPTVTANWDISRWNGGDSWFVYVRLRRGVDADAFNVRLNQLLQAHAPDRDDVSVSLKAVPLRSVHSGRADVRRASAIFSMLGALMLLTTALNYVLLCLASMARRSRVIGVHKASGALPGSIASMFAVETLLVFAGALLFGAFCYYLAMRYMSESIFSGFAAYLTTGRLWVAAGVCVAVFLIAAGIPGWVMARVPASRAYRPARAHAPAWKRALLFVEFGVTALMMSLLAIVTAQQNFIASLDPGFDPDGVVMVNHNTELTMEQRAEIYRTFPMVEDAAVTGGVPGRGYSGQGVDNGNGALFSTRIDMWADSRPGRLLGLRLTSGRFPEREGEIVVNHEFCRLLGWDPATVLGRDITVMGRARVCGVIADFVTGSYYQEQQPWAAQILPDWSNRVLIRLKPQYGSDTRDLAAGMAEAFPADKVELITLRDVIDRNYRPVMVLRILMTVASAVLLAICIIGLAGYMADEMRRRTREIAIRKVNGASVADVVGLMGRGVMLTATPAVALGGAAAWLLMRGWVEEFTVRSSWLAAWATIASMATLAIIAAVTVAASVRAAKTNPTKALKNE